MRLHISGASGSGKTTLGKWIVRQLKLPIVDIDKVYNSFVEQQERDSTVTIKSFKNNIATKLQEKFDQMNQSPLVFIGLNYMEPSIMFRGKEVHVHPYHILLRHSVGIFIDMDPKISVERKMLRDTRWKKYSKAQLEKIAISTRRVYAAQKYKMVPPDDLHKVIKDLSKLKLK